MRNVNDVMADVHRVADVYTDLHFVYTGGGHGHGYINYRTLGEPEHKLLLREACVLLIRKMFESSDLDPSLPITIVGPKTLGARMVEQIFCAGRHGELPLIINIRTFDKIPGTKDYCWAESPDKLVGPGQQIVWVDDLLNKASTFLTTNKLIQQEGGVVSGIAVLGDRSGLTAGELGVQHKVALEYFQLDNHPVSGCPYCKEERPIVRRPGHGHEFEAKNPNYPGGFIDI